MNAIPVLFWPDWSDVSNPRDLEVFLAFIQALTSSAEEPSPTIRGIVMHVPLPGGYSSSSEDGDSGSKRSSFIAFNGNLPEALMTAAREVGVGVESSVTDRVHFVSDHDFASAFMLRHGVLTSHSLVLMIRTVFRDDLGGSLDWSSTGSSASVGDTALLQLLGQDAVCTQLDVGSSESFASLGKKAPSPALPEPSISGAVEMSPALADSAFRAGLEASDAFDISTSAKSFSLVLRHRPGHVGALFNLASIMHMCGYPVMALCFIEQLLMIDQSDATAKAFLWSLATLEAIDLAPIYASLGLDSLKAKEMVKTMCVDAYTRLSKGNDLNYRHRLAMLTGVQCCEADRAYLREFYDRIADSFETKLVRHLGYRGPWTLHRLVTAQLYNALDHSSLDPGCDVSASPGRVGVPSPIGQLRILDLGCGTGLCGRVFASMCDGARRLHTNSSSSSSSSSSASSISGELFHLGIAPVCSVDEAMQDLDAAKRDLAAGTIAVNTDIIVPIESLGSRLSKSGPIMVGVDISQRMVDLASLPCNKYSLLTCGHLVDALTSLSDAICDAPTDPSAVIEKLDIVLAADTFIYVGALGLVFQHVAKLLKIGGIFAFSTEHIVEEGSGVDGERQSLYTVEYRFDDDSGEAASTVTKEGVTSGQDKGYTLQDGSARFSHRASYIAALAKRCGFTVSARERHVLRSESSIPIPGMFYALTLDASDR